ncbi:ATP-binding protein [Streptomyces sp. NPDC101455]|uniref:ATP-binding protein n=1 Tax=Streptomyces sp. NPDC101455 TaxID=3366142 RepID=UPI00382046F0
METSLTGNALRVAVTEPRGERLPYPQTSTPEDQFGRGLLIVRTLAARWAVERLTVGKTVWAELDIPKNPTEPAPGRVEGFRNPCRP